jgi:hypothetical protein
MKPQDQDHGHEPQNTQIAAVRTAERQKKAATMPSAVTEQVYKNSGGVRDVAPDRDTSIDCVARKDVHLNARKA